jgi:hypothetical protein
MPHLAHSPAMHAAARSSSFPPSPALTPHVASRHMAYLPFCFVISRRHVSFCMAESASTAAISKVAVTASTDLDISDPAALQAFMRFSHQYSYTTALGPQEPLLEPVQEIGPLASAGLILGRPSVALHQGRARPS